MKIEANDKEIQDIFSLGYFQIPRFQRPYSWEKEEVENFWNDIINDKTENYFIGSMVVFQTRKPYFGIVDGQQRLTTITIILSAIRDTFIRLNEPNLARGVHKYIEQPNIDNINEFVLNAETSFPFLQNQIQSFDPIPLDYEVGVEEQNLKIAFDLIKSKLEKEVPSEKLEVNQIDIFNTDNSFINKLKEIRDKFLSLKLVFIQLDNEDDAYLIFETLNARGRDLRTSDLVKNLILKTIKSNSISLDKPKESWNNLVKKFDDVSDSNALDTFLLHYWMSEHDYSTDKNLFSNVKSYVSENEETARVLLTSLNYTSTLYCKMLNPLSVEWSKEEMAVRNSLHALNCFKVKQQSSFVLALLRAYYDKRITLKALRQTIEKIEFFHFVFNAITSQRSSGSIATTYSSHAIQLTKSENNDQIQKVISSLLRSLSKKMPMYEEFEVKFLELSYLSNRTKNKSIIKYCLGKVLGSQANGLDINHDALTIEHIIPESLIKNGFSEDSIGSIGNLLLTDAKTNAEYLKDKSPEFKIKYLKEIDYPLSKSFIEHKQWNEELISERAKLIANKLYSMSKITQSDPNAQYFGYEWIL